jgi:hypothetical protein
VVFDDPRTVALAYIIPFFSSSLIPPHARYILCLLERKVLQYDELSDYVHLSKITETGSMCVVCLLYKARPECNVKVATVRGV